MELKNVYIGSWFPKMSLHLEEFRNFLLSGAVMDLLDKKTGLALFKKLNPQAVERGEREGIGFVQAGSGEFTFRYFDDGLLVVKKPAPDLTKDFEKILKFYQEDLAPVFAYIYSKGAKGLEIIRAPGSKKPFFVSSLGASQEEIASFFSSQNKKIDVVSSYKGLSVNYADELVLININKNSGYSEEEIKSLIENIILFNEAGRHVQKLLQTHRDIWEKAEAIIYNSNTQITDLKKDNNDLTNFSDTVANIKARIAQMKLNLIYRENTFNKKSEERLLLKFKNRNQELDYLESVFEMTSVYLISNISRLSNIYQEYQQKSLDKIQMLYIISVITGILTLGYYSNTEFDISIIFEFGGLSILITLLIYYFWNIFSFKKTKRKPKQ